MSVSPIKYLELFVNYIWQSVYIVLKTLIRSSVNYIKCIRIAWKLNGPPAIPILGNVLMITDKQLLNNYIGPGYKLYGSFVRIWLFFIPCFAILNPKDIQTVLSSKKHTEKIIFYKLLHNFLGNGLITSAAENWIIHRKLIQPYFHMKTLEKYCDTFVEASQTLVAELGQSPNELNITTFINQCVLQILHEAILGIRMEQKSGLTVENSPFRKGQLTLPIRITRPWLLFEKFYSKTNVSAGESNQKNRLQEYTKQAIQNRRKLLNNFTDPDDFRPCLLDYLLEISNKNPREFTESDVINESITFMLAGQDSVGAAISFCLFLLAKYPEHQKYCRDEIDRLPSKNNLINFQDLSHLHYVEKCIKETLRLYPSVPFIARKLGEDTMIANEILPIGSNVFIFPYATHRIADLYADAEEFQPQRFCSNCDDGGGVGVSTYGYLPFSRGPRNCIGLKFSMIEMKIIISIMLKNFMLHTIPGKTEIRTTFRLTVRAHGGLWIRLEPRSNR